MWATVPWFLQHTVVPGAMLTFCGVNANSVIVDDARPGRAGRARRRRTATRELEAPDARSPRVRPGRLQIFLRVPERAVVDRVDAHHRVVAPAEGGPRLRAGALVEDGLALAQLVRRIVDESSGVRDARIVRRGAVPDRIADRQVAALVHGACAHPAVHAVRRPERALVLDPPVAARELPQLVPADTCPVPARRVRVHRVDPGQRLVARRGCGRRGGTWGGSEVRPPSPWCPAAECTPGTSAHSRGSDRSRPPG